MRADSAAFELPNLAPNKEPRFVVEVSFNSANTDLYYITSHNDAAIPSGGLAIKGVLKGLDGIGQDVTPEAALATIGTLNFDAVDYGDAVTTLQYDKLQLGKGLRGMRVRAYVGYYGLAWSDYSLVTTQIIEDVDYDNAAYKFVCSDIQREERKDVFDTATTNLSSTVSLTAATINVYDTSSFIALEHSNSFSDAPSVTVYYFKIEDEIIRATGKTATTFTGCVRGVLNTKPSQHIIDVTTAAERRTSVNEYVYLELPAPKLAYAILTGKLIGQGAAELPPSWHLGMSTDYVRESDFSGIGEDLFDTSDDQLGRVLRFEGVEKQDGKSFVEKELDVLMGSFNPVYSDGAIGLKRMAAVLSKSGSVFQLDESNIVSHSSLKHDMTRMHNNIEVQWNWLDGKEKFTRRNTLIDTNSIAVHGLAPPIKFKFRGLNGSIHSTETLGEIFDAFRDRYSGPPLTISVTCLPSTNILEVGDSVRLKLPNVMDYLTGQPLDRTFEVQNVSLNWVTGAVTFKLFGSSQEATAIANVAEDGIVPDAFYTSEGNNLATYVGAEYDFNTDYTETGGVGHITTTSKIFGGADLTAAGSIYYHDGPLIIDSAVIFSITDNVQLRIKGHLTINGEIRGIGLGLAGAAYRASDQEYDTTYPAPNKWGNKTLGTKGFIGTTMSGGGTYTDRTPGTVYSGQGFAVAGANETAPKLSFNVKSNVVTGIPADIRGTSGSTGRILGAQFGAVHFSWLTAAGGAGGAGGAGLFVICRGASFGASGKVDTSGGDGGNGDDYGSGADPFNPLVNTSNAGSGAGGAPGAIYFAVDGVTSTVPLLDKVFAKFGATPINGTPLEKPVSKIVESGTLLVKVPYYSHYTGVGYPDADLSGYDGGARISYIIGAEAPEEDADAAVIAVPTSLILTSGTAELLLNEDGTITPRMKAAWTASPDARTTGYEVQYKKTSDSVWISSVDVIDEVETYISNVVSGIQHDVRIRASDAFRNTSEWVTVSAHTVLGKTALPSDVTGFNCYQNGDALVTKWDKSADADLSGFELRYLETGGSGLWDDGTVLNSVTKGTNITTVDIPDGDWLVMIKAIDTSGNYSANYGSKSLAFSSSFDVIDSDSFAPAFAGTLTNMVWHHTGKLVPDSQNLASDDDWDTFDITVVNPFADCYYEVAEYDAGFDGDTRVSANILSALVPINPVGSASPTLEIDYRLDAGSYDGFELWSVGNANFRYLKARVHVDTSIGVAIISEFTRIVDAIEWSQRGESVAVSGSGATTVTFPLPFHNSPYVSVLPIGATAAFAVIENKTSTGFDVRLFDSGGQISGTIDWSAIGV